MTTVAERIRGHYEVREIPYGKAYVWCPDFVVVECDCGEKASLTASETICKCGADHTTLIQTELKSRAPSEETPSTEDECREWERKQDEYLHSEYYDWLEWREIE